MRRTISFTVTLAFATAATFLLAASPQEPPTQAPNGQPLPPGHPAVSMPPKPVATWTADPKDVQTIEAIIDAYYDSVSGAKGEARDWERFVSLFMKDARFIVTRTIDGEVVPLALSPQEFVDSNRTYFERGGYFEKDIHREIDSFGHIAQVFSTYATRRAENDPEPYSRGINSIQLVNTGDRWWISTIMWDSEQPDINPIPAIYLPASKKDN